ncbi:MAG: PEP-CTERM sorting domain-containing protein [Cyanobacteria bacterium SBLK]|nr:PEP-CTERM sorting domain-containing protein [Cyanobacteria bacterium SBLK]
MKKILFSLIGTAILSAIAGPAEAAILSVGPGGKLISAPASVFDDAPGYEDPEFMLGFNEKQNVLLTENLAVDRGIIAAGTRVSSHMIFVNTPGNQVLHLDNVLWEFDGTILGVMSDRNGRLEAASSDLLGADNTLYPGSFGLRGMEGLPDDVYFGVGTDTLDVSIGVSEPGDWIRVVTVASEPVPEPASILSLLAVGTLGGSSLLKRKPQEEE